MLELKVHDGETSVVLQFEHSLLALSKWEAKTKIAFLASREKTPMQLVDYFKCMLVSPEHDPNLVNRLSPEQLEELTDYINDTQSATQPGEPDKKKSRHAVTTSEVIYGWLVGLKIPFHPAETWHLNRVMMLIQVVQANNEPEKKLSRAEALSRWQQINEANRKRLNSTG